MFKCINCSHIEELPFAVCPVCSAPSSYTEAQIRDHLYIIHKAIKSRKYEVAVSGYRALADIGHTPSEIEYAKILEQGELVPEDKEGAMHYYYSAACKNDPYAAYRYSRLIAERSASDAEFWLLYSAVLGSADSYAEVGSLYSEKGDEVSANYYYALAAESDNRECAALLAKRCYKGIGQDPSDEHAKWYLEKFKLPPFRLIPLAFKLRSVISEKPEPIKTARIENLTADLAQMAKERGYYTAYFNLISMMAWDDIGRLFTLGTLYAEGVGCDQNIERAQELLKRAASRGNVSAYRYLGDMHLSGIHVPQNIDEAVNAYTMAAKLGDPEAYELIGDIYHEGRCVRCSLSRAIEYYDMAAKLGNSSAYAKSEKLKDEREDFFKTGEQVIDEDAALAFKSYAISAGMGYSPAYERLARCYRYGIGTKRDRQRAFMWYEYAAKEGDAAALYGLGVCYARGIGTAFDFKKAVKTLMQAKSKGEPKAEAEIIRLMENKKRAMARSLYSMAMGLMYQKKFELAKKILDAGATLEHPKAIYTLGCAYEFGIGTETDRVKAFELYERAYELKFRDPRQGYKQRVLKIAKF